MKINFIFYLLLFNVGFSQINEVNKRHSFNATFLDNPPKVDGNVLSDPIWESIPYIDEMIQSKPSFGFKASERTVIRVAFTNSNLYVSAICYDSDPDNLVIFDADNDGLSYEEELVFSTNPNLEDTDKDGYKDGQEIINLFNPLLPSKDLLTSGLVIRFNNSIYNYLLLRPKVWLAKAEGGNLAEILILPNTETGESFSISSISNTSGLSLTEALVQNEDILGSAANFENYSLDGKEALRSKDGRKVISLNGEYIVVIAYDTGSLGSANFDSTFAMMLNSFKWSVVDNNPSEEDES